MLTIYKRKYSQQGSTGSIPMKNRRYSKTKLSIYNYTIISVLQILYKVKDIGYSHICPISYTIRILDIFTIYNILIISNFTHIRLK